MECSVDGCATKRSAKGYCPKHYARWKRLGDPVAEVVHQDHAPLRKGTVFGRLTVLRLAKEADRKRRRYAVRCECGNELEVNGDDMKAGRTTSCGCAKTRVQPGDEYGWLTVLARSGTNIHKDPLWKCLCRCGTEKVVAGSHLREGQSRSCGCLRAAGRAVQDSLPKGPAGAHRRKAHYWKKYGLTVEEADAMLEKGCAICRSFDDLCIDHNHTSGKARSALCRRCNSMLGMAAEDPARLRTAAVYLETHTTE